MVAASAEGDQYPPAYSKSGTPSSDAVPPPINASSSSSASSAPTLTLVPPTNFLTIIRDSNNIKGGYTIDPSLPVPPGALPSLGEDGKALNMRIASKWYSIDVVVEVVCSGDTKGPSRLATDTKHGSTTIAVHDRGPSRFRLKATSKYGAIVIRLPSTFLGAVSTWIKHGKLTFSPGIQARLVTFSEKDREARFFIGDYTSTGYEDDESWLGDHLRVEAEYGKVRIEFVDEEREIMSIGKGASRKKGLFSRLSS